MADKKNITEADRDSARRHLRELIAALDRRQPHIERVGEVEIALAATALKRKAERRLADLDAERNKNSI
jgi:hypothetical protein